MEEWDKLDEESDTQYWWFNEFLMWYDLSVKNFYNDLAKRDIKEYPKLETFYRWSSNYRWRKRKKAYISRKLTEQRYRLEDMNYRKKEEIFIAKHNLIISAIRKCKEDFESGKITASQFSSWVNGINNLLNDNRLDVFEPTEIKDTSVTANVDATVEDNISLFDKIDQVDSELAKIDEHNKQAEEKEEELNKELEEMED